MTSVSLANIAARIDMLEIRCTRCDRTGRRSVARLIDQHGKAMLLPDLRSELAKGCDHADGHDFNRCDVFFLQLTELTSG